MQDRRKVQETEQLFYRPSGHRILVLLDDIEIVNKTDSGIVLPGSTNKKEQEAHQGATVIMMGSTCFNLPQHGSEPWCKEGDRVLIAPYSGKRMPGNPRLRLINDEDVTAVELEKDGVKRLFNAVQEADERFQAMMAEAKKLAEEELQDG